MADVSTFLTGMAALSAATQTFVEHVIKKNWEWLDEAKPGKADKLRHVAVHAIVFAAGALLAGTIGLTPLNELGVAKQFGMVPNALMAGLLVSFGGSFFDEALGAVRQFKKAQEQARKGGKA